METTGPLVLALHAAATLALTGLVWFVHVVHYPLFARVGEGAFAGYHAAHLRRTGPVVAPLMGLEAALALWLLASPPAGVSASLAALGLALVAVVWASTFLGAVPCHDRLKRGFSAEAHRALLRWNGVRAAAWSARAALVLLLAGSGV